MFTAQGQLCGFASVPGKPPLDFILEVDLRSSIPSRRTLTYIIQDRQQGIVMNNLPPAVKFAVLFQSVDDTYTFLSLTHLQYPSVLPNDAEVFEPFDGFTV